MLVFLKNKGKRETWVINLTRFIKSGRFSNMIKKTSK
jgi:hypothetical protein